MGIAVLFQPSIEMDRASWPNRSLVRLAPTLDVINCQELKMSLTAAEAEGTAICRESLQLKCYPGIVLVLVVLVLMRRVVLSLRSLHDFFMACSVSGLPSQVFFSVLGLIPVRLMVRLPFLGVFPRHGYVHLSWAL